MKQTNSGRYKVVFKILLLFLILNMTLPFYAGVTTSALESLAYAHYKGEEGKNPSGADGQVQPPAKVDNNKPDPEPAASVQVIPLPSAKPTPSPSPAPEDLPVVTPSPSPGSDTESKPTHEPAPDSTPNPASSPGPNKDDDEKVTPEAPVNSGVLLQDLLDRAYRHDGDKVAYLTFDDGPTPSITSRILDILNEENIKATFFSIGSSAERHPELIRREYEEGHGIGNHTYSHVFKHIYAKPKNFVNELLKTEKVLQSILGEDKTFRLSRFPGGSFGKALKPFRKAANKAGFGYVDWNSLNGDAESVKSRSAEKLIERLKETVRDQSGLIVLMHDAPKKETTIDALPEIIQFLKDEGYRFELIPGSRR